MFEGTLGNKYSRNEGIQNFLQYNMINILATSKLGIIFLNKFPSLPKSSPSQKRKQKLSNRDFCKIKKSNC